MAVRCGCEMSFEAENWSNDCDDDDAHVTYSCDIRSVVRAENKLPLISHTSAPCQHKDFGVAVNMKRKRKNKKSLFWPFKF